MSLAVYSLEVTTSGSLSSPRLCRLESWLEREARLEERWGWMEERWGWIEVVSTDTRSTPGGK